MPENIEIGAFVFGAVLILIGITGGNFQFFGGNFPALSDNRLRFISFVLGTALIVFALNIELPFNSEKNNPKQVEVQYGSLKKSLAVKNWESADTQTMNILLAEANKVRLNHKLNQNWLDPADIRVLPCSELNNINQIWAEASKNKFGFVVQSRVWKSVGGTTATEPDNPNVRKNFSSRVGSILFG
jgi:GUN4-like